MPSRAPRRLRWIRKQSAGWGWHRCVAAFRPSSAMAGKPIEFHQEAAAEYEAAFAWYFERSRLAASKFADELDEAINQISHSPRRWPNHIHGTRKFLLTHFPFLIVYR